MRQPVIETVLKWGADKVDGSTVSIAISLFNYAKYIEECLESVAAQDHRALELIIVDDKSDKDDSVDVARSWMTANQKRFRRGTLARHVVNQGLAGARNTAFSLARAPLVFVMDADNAIFPTAIRKLRRALLSADKAAAYSQLVMFGDEQSTGLGDYWSKKLLAAGAYIDAMALVRRSAWADVGGYTHMDGWEDYDFWCKLVEADLEGVYVPELLCRYRVHNTSMLRTETARQYDTLYNRMMLRHPWLTGLDG